MKHALDTLVRRIHLSVLVLVVPLLVAFTGRSQAGSHGRPRATAPASKSSKKLQRRSTRVTRQGSLFVKSAMLGKLKVRNDLAIVARELGSTAFPRSPLPHWMRGLPERLQRAAAGEAISSSVEVNRNGAKLEVKTTRSGGGQGLHAWRNESGIRVSNGSDSIYWGKQWGKSNRIVHGRNGDQLFAAMELNSAAQRVLGAPAGSWVVITRTAGAQGTMELRHHVGEKVVKRPLTLQETQHAYEAVGRPSELHGLMTSL